MLYPVTARTQAAPPAQPQAQQQQQQNEQAKSVAGKVTAIGSDKRSFSMDVHDRDASKPMQFVIDNNTQVQGHVAVGTNAIVQYSPTEDGKNLALSVAPQDTQ
jgi:predicted ATPase